MNYNYPQPQYPSYNTYRPNQWNQVTAPLAQVRPVSSIEEVRACPIDFDGSVFYFADVANKRIYTKQINIDGTATINLYELKIPTQADQIDTSFVTRQEFEQVINQLKEMLIPTEKESVQSAVQPKPLFNI